jgi:O-antigen/teichoic acid export membrane protein
MQVGRATAFGAVAWRLLPAGKGVPIDAMVRQYVLERSRLLFTARFLGTLQHQAPTLLIGVLVGPAAVGIYDAILRLPRFVKAALSIMSTTLMPAAMRLDAAGDQERLQAIGRVITSLLPALIFPPLAILAVFSGDLLKLWLGGDFVSYAPWLAACMIVPALNTIVSFQNSTLLNRAEYLRQNNLIAFVQTAVQMALSLALVRWLAQNAFILGQVAATLCVFVWQIRLGHSYLHPSTQLRSRFFALVSLTLLVVTACIAVLPSPVFSRVVLAIVAAVAVTNLLWALALRYFLTPDCRAVVRSMVRIVSKPFGIA